MANTYTMLLVEYHDGLADGWDAFIEEAPAGTFLHSRKFLSYHGERFTDRSVVLQDNGGGLLAVFPAAEDRDSPGLIVSHPGSTYGGMVCREGFTGDEVIRGLREIIRHYAELGYRGLRYKAVPYIYRKMPCDDDLYALFRLGADRYRCDLGTCIDLESRGKVGSQRKRGLKKAARQAIQLTMADEYIPEFWRVLEENLAGVHGTVPVHTLEEIMSLRDRFPSVIRFVMAVHEGRVVGGLVLFASRLTVHAQYIASNQCGRELAALDLAISRSIERAAEEGVRYFSLGICNEDDGRTLNSGLYRFKLGFGAGGVAHEFYHLDFNPASLPAG